MTNLFALATSVLLLSSTASALWPIPAHYDTGNSTFWLSPDVKLEFGPDSYSGSRQVCLIPAPLSPLALVLVRSVPRSHPSGS